MANGDRLYINGINGLTGDYLIPPMTYEEAASFVKGQPPDTPWLKLLKNIWRIISQPHLGLPAGVSADDITQAGWGIIYHKDEVPEVRKKLEPLIEHRRKQIGDDDLVKGDGQLVYDGKTSATQWLAQHGVGAGTQKPKKVPFYLLVIGSPEQIPFEFTRQLDLEYAVGRLHFDAAEQYEQYVQSLITYELGEAPTRAKEVVYFGTRHKFDKATQLSADLLIDPLVEASSGDTGFAAKRGFRTPKFRGDLATREALARLLAPPSGAKPPALLFTASHGYGYPKPYTDQEKVQGSLICQDWQGLGSIRPQDYFTANDLLEATGVQVHGLIAFHFACYSAGTPLKDITFHKYGKKAPKIAKKPFIAALPKALLSHSQGGALACIGHVERAFTTSIEDPAAGPLIQPFQNAIDFILDGKPVDYAVKDFLERYSRLGDELNELLKAEHHGEQIEDKGLATTWISHNDAGGYVVLGDPAVRLRMENLE